MLTTHYLEEAEELADRVGAPVAIPCASSPWFGTRSVTSETPFLTKPNAAAAGGPAAASDACFSAYNPEEVARSKRPGRLSLRKALAKPARSSDWGTRAAHEPVIALVDDDRNILTSVSIALQAGGIRDAVYTDGPRR